MIIYNTASRKKEELKTIKPNFVGIYSCGPTVYSSPHIGNMYAYVAWDVLVRSLEFLGYEVHQVINITDVGHLVTDADEGEDKMEKGSKKEGLSAWDLAKKYEAEFVENLDKLNIKRPWKMPRATDHIKEQIELIQLIEKNGFTYQISDGIYFDTSKFPAYGDFAHLDIEKLKAGASLEINPEKKSQSDFALWKFSPKGGTKRQMEWKSPWGTGFPGWHIECTAMSTEYLGNPFDIHTGGEDHIAIHHTNEIAQAFGAWGKQTANYWMHNAFITFKGAKISKSSGGLYTIFDLEKMGYDPLDYRYLVLGSHYRKGMEFSEENLKAAKIARIKLNELAQGQVGVIDEGWLDKFKEKISDDLAMPEALAIIWIMWKSQMKIENKIATLLEMDKVLGLNLGKKVTEEIIPQEIQDLSQKRTEAKINKDWTEADKLRDLIKEKGFEVQDGKDGVKIRKI
ncbi:MAG: cysteine--tRNA ligase [Candidatus Shapirobacteria bacterium]|jgi:cysteinyl-tRNA synthetase